ncbi:hypothetical protein SDJN02_14718, partial [Cucurbita argyrosperma subsp. argyrosperma]
MQLKPSGKRCFICRQHQLCCHSEFSLHRRQSKEMGLDLIPMPSSTVQVIKNLLCMSDVEKSTSTGKKMEHSFNKQPMAQFNHTLPKKKEGVKLSRKYILRNKTKFNKEQLGSPWRSSTGTN